MIEAGTGKPALFDEYQSRENARQGFWNGLLPPIGYRVVANAADGHLHSAVTVVAP